MTWTQIIDGIDFGEGPRWHDGRFWFSDFYQHTISSVGDDGVRRLELDFGDGHPSGLGWLPDGRLLFVSMLDRRVMRVESDGEVVVHADLSELAPGECNDMIVDRAGNAYVGNFGVDGAEGEAPLPTNLILVRPDGSFSEVATGIDFPNGAVIVNNGKTLVIGETFGGKFSAYDIAPDATLSNRRTWAEVPGMYPDGCCVDAEGAIWFSDAFGQAVARVREGGEVTHTLPTPNSTFACMLGGENGDQLYALISDGAGPEVCAGTATGALVVTTVEVASDPSNLP